MLYGSVGRVGLRALSGVAFSPLSLFANGEQGVWYDPSDFSTLFQDAAGTTPVTAVEQPVGLVLDKSKGLVLGSEASPALSAYQTELTGTWTASGANYAFTDTVGGQVRPGVGWPSISLTPGWYRVVVVVASITGATQIRMDGIGASDQLLTTGTNTRTVLVTVNSRPRLRLEDTSTTVGDGFAITSVSVRELPGNHAFQSTSTARPVLSGRVNLLTYTEQFDNAVWRKNNVSITANTTATTDPLGGNTADVLSELAVTNFHFLDLLTALPFAATQYTFTACLKQGSSRYGGIHINDGTPRGCSIDLQTGTLGTPYGSATATVADVGNGWYRLTVTATASATASGQLAIYVSNSNSLASYAGNTNNNIYIWGADLRPANSGAGLPAYQRVGAATAGTSSAAGTGDYDTTGFPLYLRFDGTDDFLVTGTINPGSVDKAQVFAGVRKLSDAAAGVLVESSVNAFANAGAIAITAPPATLPAYSFRSSGSVGVTAQVNSGYAAPVSSVVTGFGDIAGDVARLRVNGTQVAETLADQGTGNFLAYPLYIGRRGDATVPFNGHVYSLLVRFSATNMDAATIASTETWVNQRTKAY